MSATPQSTSEGYSQVAAEYARQYFHEFEQKPRDRELLVRFAALVNGRGPACDMGCGPGEVARFLKDLGVDVLGVDLSAGMVAQASQLSPDIAFHQGSMLALDFPACAWAGIAAFYSLIHIPREQVTEALRELWRVLQPGGVLLVAFHVGEQTVHLDEWWDKPVSIDFNFYQVAEMEAWLEQAGFENIEVTLRDPYPGVEHPSQRAYVFAWKPASTGSF